MSESQHWIVTKLLAGHSISFNMDTLLTMWFAMAILIVFAILIIRNASVIPTRLQYIGESIINYFSQITSSSMGEEESKKHNPLILTLFMFILTANLVGQIPLRIIHLKSGELASPNNDINMTAAMAIVVSIYYIYYGIKKHGVMKFFFHGWSVGGIMTTLIDGLELFVRPFSLALRLFANILAGEIMVLTFLGMLAYFLPLPFMLFELFVALIQALVFALLSTTYITMAVNEEE